jgi:hypothetical protein
MFNIPQEAKNFDSIDMGNMSRYAPIEPARYTMFVNKMKMQWSDKPDKNNQYFIHCIPTLFSMDGLTEISPRLVVGKTNTPNGTDLIVAENGQAFWGGSVGVTPLWLAMGILYKTEDGTVGQNNFMPLEGSDYRPLNIVVDVQTGLQFYHRLPKGVNAGRMPDRKPKEIEAAALAAGVSVPKTLAEHQEFLQHLPAPSEGEWALRNTVQWVYPPSDEAVSKYNLYRGTKGTWSAVWVSKTDFEKTFGRPSTQRPTAF